MRRRRLTGTLLGMGLVSGAVAMRVGAPSGIDGAEPPHHQAASVRAGFATEDEAPRAPERARFGAAPLPVRDVRFDSVRTRIQRLVREGGAPSIVVAVAKDGGILWEEGFGWANRERGVAATPHVPYSLASVTKPITATAILMLSERGRIDLDAPIESYLGGIRLNGLAWGTRGVTPRRILAHSAGLPRRFRIYRAGDPVPTAGQVLGRHGTVWLPPGERFRYSNIGYLALGEAVSNASGKPYGEFLRSEIFLPLGMLRSSLYVHPEWAAEAATRYDDRRRPLPYYVSDHPPSGDVWASAHDVLRFALFHLGTPLPDQLPILSARSLESMREVASAPGNPEPWDYGLGWQLDTHRGYRRVRHGGGQPGVSNQITLYPTEGLAIVVLSNHVRTPVWDVSDWISAAVLPDARSTAGDSGAAAAGSSRGG